MVRIEFGLRMKRWLKAKELVAKVDVDCEPGPKVQCSNCDTWGAFEVEITLLVLQDENGKIIGVNTPLFRTVEKIFRSNPRFTGPFCYDCGTWQGTLTVMEDLII